MVYTQASLRSAAERIITPDRGEISTSDSRRLLYGEKPSINPADWKVRAGAVKDIIPVKFPYIPGCDLAGTVLEVGEGALVSSLTTASWQWLRIPTQNSAPLKPATSSKFPQDFR